MIPNPKFSEIRPLSAGFNKLTKLKKNIYPNANATQNINLNHNTNFQNNFDSNNFISNNNTNFESSPNKKIISTSNSKTRIKSANPNFLDREKLYEENIKLKNDINKLKENLNLQKKENYILEIDINKKDKLIQDMANETQNSLVNPIFRSNDLSLFKQKNIFKANESKLMINLKRQFKDLKKEFTIKKEESENLRKNLKNTKLNELQLENRILLEEMSKLKILYENLLKQNLANEKYYLENLELKEMNNKKDFIILNFQEKLKNMQTEIFERNEETVRMNKFTYTQNEKIKKLKKDLKFQYQINEKLIMTTGNIKESIEYLELKQEMTKKLKEAKKEIFYFKEQNAKNERKISNMKNSSSLPSIGKFSSLEKNIDPNPEENTNSKILLINSKLQELIKQNENLKKENFNFSEKIKIYENNEYGIDNLLKRDTSSINLNSFNLTPHSMSSIEILSENQINEMIYVLIKNFEANRIDANVIEMRLFEDENISSHYQEGKEKLFCEKLSNAILNLLKIKFDKDKTSIYSLIKSYLFTVSNYAEKKDFENFKKDFVSLFSAIEFYTSEQKGIMTRKLKKKFLQHVNPLKDACKFYDDNSRGYITFSNLKKILDHFEFKPNSTLEFLVYMMKSFNDDTASIYDLKYENFFKIFESSLENDKEEMLKNNFEEREELEEENEESDRDINEDEEIEIEISSTEYKRKISNIIIKITKAQTNKEEIFEDRLKNLVTEKVSDYRAIKLSKIIELLNEDYKIILDTLDIYCFFAKFRHDENEQGEFEEYIDCDKLIEEVNLFIAAKESKLLEKEQKDKKENKDQEKVLINFGHPSRQKSLDDFVRVELETNSDLLTPQINSADFIQLIKNELILKKISFEEFFESGECLNIEKIFFVSKNENKNEHGDDDTCYNRYIDILDFEQLLLMKEIIVLLHDPLKKNILKINRDLYNFSIQDETMFSANKINIDYIKFIIEDCEENKKFFGYKEIKMNRADYR